MTLILFGIILLDLLISFWNARCAGKGWVESKHNGGFARFFAWIVAIQSALGFTWCYLVILTIVAMAFHWLPVSAAPIALDLGYLIVIPGLLFSGMVITLDSWAKAYRNRTFANVGIAGYNTFAQIYNTYNAIQGIGPAFSAVMDFFTGGSKKSSSSSGSSDDDGALGMLVILLVLVALAGGIATTAALIHHYAASEDLPVSMASRSSSGSLF